MATGNRIGSYPLLHVAVYGSGLGHAARMIPLINVLADSFEIYCTSWGEGLSLLKRNGLECVEVPPVDVQWGSEGRMAFKRTVRSLPSCEASDSDSVCSSSK
ncbi:MAG: hypothetical protein JRN68_08385 [Nitrososphaerota archaeon]|nr:hypothetical protein [Nitrososphaerota archaeon]